MTPSRKLSIAAFLAAVSLLEAQTIELVPVVQKPVSRMVTLPAEIEPFLSVGINARVAGYVERVLVDRGSAVKQGDLLVELSAPEMKTRIAEAESKVQAIASERAQAEAERASAQTTLTHLKKAAETPGAIAAIEIETTQRRVEALDALVRTKVDAARSAESAVKALRELEGYLRITAPFDGVITERRVHPGALAGPGAAEPLLQLQQISRLRVTVAVPEEDVAGVVKGARVEFKVPGYPDRTFAGTVARPARVLDPKTRTMPVELDVSNADGALSPGMFPAVKWPVRRSKPALYVPKTAVVTTTERVFVVRSSGAEGKAEWVNVSKGAADGDFVEVLGALKPGDLVVKRATDEMRDGSILKKK